jgi:glycosyltransferase involved in cell wall biosynthesis
VIRLSVVVPFFNVERYAAESLRSLSHNAAADIEFVLVDDGSTDATSSILSDGARRLPGSNLVELTRNFGVSAARNAGLAASSRREATVAPTHKPCTAWSGLPSPFWHLGRLGSAAQWILRTHGLEFMIGGCWRQGCCTSMRTCGLARIACGFGSCTCVQAPSQ